MTLARGDRVGDYVLIERLGSGSFGEVWKANHLLLPRTVALKVAKSDRAVPMLERESIAQYSLDHPGIVRVLEAHLSAEPPHCVLEYVAGPSLRDLLQLRGHLEFPDVSAIFGQLVSALTYAHDHGVVHADLKPENILIEQRVPGGRAAQWTVRVTDFQLGQADPVGEGDQGGVAMRHSLQTGEPFGTFRYMAPEQETRGSKIDARADLFSLGVVLFEMLTGSLPQGRDLPSDLRPSISWWWDHIFSRCFTGLERRYQSIHELQRDLSCATTGPVWGEMPSQRRPPDVPAPTEGSRPLAARAKREATAGVVRPRPARTRGIAARRRTQPPRTGFAIVALVGLALLIPAVLSPAAWESTWSNLRRSARLRTASTAPAARRASLSSRRARNLLRRYVELRRYRDEVPLASEEVVGYTMQLARLRRSADTLGLSLRDAVELESGRHTLDVYRTKPVLRLRWRQGEAVQWSDASPELAVPPDGCRQRDRRPSAGVVYGPR